MILARFLVPAVALLALFMVPWQAALLFVLLASLVLPPAGLALGIIGDLIYFSPGVAFAPYFSIFGLTCTVVAILVHRFVKTRIME